MKDELYIFVEGPTDRLFIENVFGKILRKDYKNYYIVEYAVKDKKKVNNYINTINQMKNADYVFIADQDGNCNKKERTLAKYNKLEKEKVFLSVYEIESWIIAGISRKFVEKYNLKFNTQNTSNITKEIFKDLVPSKMDEMEFISTILENYDIKSAVCANESLGKFRDYLTKKSKREDCF